ncbi:MAG TPA: AraC family transcriptional regulator [Alloacidobacterium sp.]|nr:AraC family transcriptional regulator [Alloacidobacterium sp.]
MTTTPQLRPEPAPAPVVVNPGQQSMRVRIHTDEPGVLVSPGYVNTLIAIHVGRPVHLSCKRAGTTHFGTAIHGDVDIIPSGTPAIWENKEKDTVLICSLPPTLLHAAAEGLDINSDRVEIRNRFQARDSQIEHIGWALKAEMERGYPSGQLYLDSLAMAMAVRLLQGHSSLAREPELPRGAMQGHRLKRVLAFIEEHLSDDLSLETIAAAAGVSAPHCKVLFRRALGVPIHQYVIRRRIERALSLLREGQLPISQVALDTGFAHQSHLARHMRRLIGVSPGEYRNSSR